MTPTERRTINGCLRSLRGQSNTSERVRAALADPHLRIWLDTWVIPALEILAQEGRTVAELKLAEEISR